MLIHVDADISVSELTRALQGFILRPEIHQGEMRYKLSRAPSNIKMPGQYSRGFATTDGAHLETASMTIAGTTTTVERVVDRDLAMLQERRECACGMLVWPGEHRSCHEPEREL